MTKSEINSIHPRDQIVLIINEIYRGRLTTTSGGNISVMGENGDIWITPAALDKGKLTATDIVCLKNDGMSIGCHKPSSEYLFHKAIYKVRPDIKAIIHAHPPALVAFSIVRQIPDTNIIPHVKNSCGKVGYVSYGLPGSMELGELIANEFEKGFNAIVLENHGTVIGGTDLEDAFQRFETFEFCAKTIIKAKSIGIPNYLTDSLIENYKKQHSIFLPEMQAVEYPSEELDIRSEIKEIVFRACRQGLMIGTFGTVSVRWQKNDFLITPANLTRYSLREEDIVQIKDGRREPKKIPNNSIGLHYEIYKKNPKVNSIIEAIPPNLMAFAITAKKLDVRTIPESWIFLQDVPGVSFSSFCENQESVLNLISENTPAVMIQNDSFLVTGNKLIDTFDRLEIAEFSAKSLIMSTKLGEMVPINSLQTEELREKYVKHLKL